MKIEQDSFKKNKRPNLQMQWDVCILFLLLSFGSEYRGLIDRYSPMFQFQMVFAANWHSRTRVCNMVCVFRIMLKETNSILRKAVQASL